MAEIAGLLLGAIALAGPAYQCYSKCEELFNDVCNHVHTREFSQFAETFIFQKGLFYGQCELMLRDVYSNQEARDILSNVYSNQEARDMLSNFGHERWRELRNTPHETSPLQLLGFAFVGVQRSLEEIERKLSEVLEKVTKGEKTGERVLELPASEGALVQNMRTASTSPDTSGKSLRRVKAKIHWALYGKSEIKDCLKRLTKQNETFRRLRKQECELRKERPRARGSEQVHHPPPSFTRRRHLGDGLKKFPASGSSDSDQAQEMFAIRDSAQRLFQDIASTGGCACHKMHLRLDVLPQKSTSVEGFTRSFRLVMSPGEQNGAQQPIESKDSCVCLLVKALRDRKGKGVAVSGVETKKIDISLQIKDGSADSDQTGTPTSKNRPQNKLSRCTMIQQLSFTDLEKAHQPGYLGILSAPNAGMSLYRHALYQETHTFSASARRSLSQMISTKNQFLPRLERMRMAVVLSLSMLLFGSFSTAWFNEHWRSSDVFFFLDEHRQRALQLEPHIVTQFSSNRSNSPVELNSSPRRCVARNSQLYSLAVVLAEIGLSSPLGATSEGKGIPNNDDPMNEYVKLQQLIEGEIPSVVGPRYAKVVERCLYCDFGLGEGDFTKREVQLSFHKVVVEELRKCLDILRDDEEFLSK